MQRSQQVMQGYRWQQGISRFLYSFMGMYCSAWRETMVKQITRHWRDLGCVVKSRDEIKVIYITWFARSANGILHGFRVRVALRPRVLSGTTRQSRCVWKWHRIADNNFTDYFEDFHLSAKAGPSSALQIKLVPMFKWSRNLLEAT